MKKSLIALAVASAVSAPAFAATSNVDVYGKLHVSVSAFNDQADAVNDVQVSSNASRIGFKGAEDLGGGLSAIWQIESGVSLDEQAGTWASRNSFVGLKGGFGSVLVGNHDTPLKLVGRSVDLFGDTMADSRNVMGGGSDTRADNVVAYMSPNFGGLSFAAAYTTDLAVGAVGIDGISGSTLVAANGADRDAMSAYNLSATYANGPLYLGLGYGDGDAHEALGMGKHIRAAAGFTFGNFKIVGQYDTIDGETIPAGTAYTVGTTSFTLPADVTTEDYEAWMVGAAYTMGNVVLKANYMTGEDDNCTGDGCEAEQWTIGADYNLSKRTSVYALYSDGQNVTMGAGAGSTDQVSGFATTGDEDVSVISLGVVHSF